MYLIKNIEIYNPEYLGKKDILFSEKIELIDNNIEVEFDGLTIIDGNDKLLLPGFIDNHVHITGGGGEGSFKSRVPEAMLSEFTTCGITTVVSMLGTDGTTRSVEALVSKAKALKEEGLSVYALTGSYEVPTTTLTNNIRKDITFIDEIIGTKIAMSDHRSSMVTNDEFARVASDTRVAGMISGKSGSVCIHIGDHKKGLDFIFKLLEETPLPIKTFRPTHVSRQEKLLNDSFKFAKMGGFIDITAGNSPINTLKKSEEANVNQSQITISSDGYGSWSKYDELGNLLTVGVQSVDVLYDTFKQLVHIEKYDITKALQYFTTNCANSLAINNKKGSIKKGLDSDLLIVDKDLEIDSVFALGKAHILDKELLIKGTYEK